MMIRWILIAIFAGLAASASPAAPDDGRKVLYYRNPMGLPDTSPAPKKDWMGMDYIPVYEGEDAGSDVKISLDRVQRTGVRSEPVEKRILSRAVLAPGTAKVDERTLRSVTLRADGFIEKLHVNETGKHVKAGEPLFRLYSPDILRAAIDARQETVERGKSPPGVLWSDERLRNYDVPDSVIAEMKRTGRAMRAFDWPAPASGVVIEKKAVEGQMAKMGDELFRIADLSSIWVVADVAERDIGQVKVGARAKVAFRAFPGEAFSGTVTFILHELDMKTRAAKARIEVANPGHRIRHEMYADVEIEAEADEPRLAVPKSSVIDSGTRQAVILDKGEGRFAPRAVKLGLRGDDYVEVTDGIAEGDKVVVSANFLIDAESNLKAALQGFTAGAASHSGEGHGEP